jgi:DNA repair exonuclease SbcCD ATPase subunit
MMSDIQNIRNTLEQRKGQRQQVETSLEKIKTTIKEKKRDLRRHEQAREIIREIGLKTQQQLQYNISEITTLALEAVFPYPYQLVVEFVQRRNKTECDLYFDREGSKTDPLSAAGGGVVDVASFALRVASWSMQQPRSRNTLILDEPFRYLSTDLLPKAGEMLQQISKQLNLQIIMITHEEELTENADKSFHVIMKKGISTVT